MYPKGLGHILAGDVAFGSDTIKALFVNSSQTYNSAHEFVSDLTAGDIIDRSGALSSPTTTSGVADAADETVSAVTTGNTIAAIVVYKDTGADASSILLAWIDHDSGGSAISQATNGGDIDIQWNASGIFSI